jgi:hypothetical protein
LSDSSTNVGNITARLVLDADQFDRDMATARTEADRLDGRNVNVDVHANTAEAIAGLRELEVAENRLRIAQLNLDDANTRGGATEQQRLRAQNALITAEDRYDRALQARQQAVRDATEAERAAAAATDATAAATDRDTSSTDRNADAKKGQFSWMQALIAAAPLLFASTTELAAAAVGMGTSFTLMGLAGAAAVKGIKEEMQQGTAEGEAYSSGLTILKGDLDQLSQTAAVSMVSSFSEAVGRVNDKMPFLNQMAGDMAAQLGKIGGGLLSDVLTGLQRMSPLIEQGATSLGDFVGWLGHFTSADGFDQFVSYATQNLPQVITFLEDVVGLAGHLIAAFAPLGPVVTGALDGLVNILNNLPSDRLVGLVTAALTIAPAFNIAKTAVALFGESSALELGLFGASVNLTIPVIGVFLAALAGLGMGLAAAAASQQQATVAASAYADALERDGNAIGQYTTQMAAKKLADEGAYDAAQKLGISQDILTKAVTGNADALKQVQDAANGAKKAYDDANAAAIASQGATGGATDKMNEQRDAADKLLPVLQNNIDAIKQQQHVNEQVTTASVEKAAADQQGAAALGVTTQAYRDASAAEADAAQKTRDSTVAMQMQNDAAALLKASLDALNGKALSAAQAQNAFDSSLANMGTHVDKVGKTVHFTTASIGDMSAASVALRGQLNSQVANLQAVVEANGGLSNSTGQAKAQMEAMRQQIIDNAVAHGVDRDAVTQYIDKILQIPASVPPTKIEADTAQAEAALARVQADIAAIHDKTVTITTVNTGAGENAPGTGGGIGLVHAQATGGWAGHGVAYFASGGSASRYARGTDTIPTMLSPGEFTVRAAAASRVGAPALEYINRTGQLPPAQQAQGPFQISGNLYLDSGEFLGKVQGVAQSVARSEIGAAVRDAAAMRPGVG